MPVSEPALITKGCEMPDLPVMIPIIVVVPDPLARLDALLEVRGDDDYRLTGLTPESRDVLLTMRHRLSGTQAGQTGPDVG